MLAGFLNQFIVEILGASIITLTTILFKVIKEWRKALVAAKRQRDLLLWSPDNTKVCAISKSNGNHEISLMDLQTGDKKNLPYETVNGENPIWSPDSSKILFVSDKDGNCEIYVFDVYGNNLKRLTFDPLDNVSPQWSPDGKSIVYLTRKNGSTEVSVLSFDEN